MNSNPFSRLSRSSRTVAVLLLAVGAAAAMALQVLMPPVERSARHAQPVGAPAIPAPGEGPLIDHSVVDRDDLLPEPDPSPLSVAAYGS